MLVYVRKKFLSLFARFGEQSGFGVGGFDRLVLAGRRETNSQQILFKARNRLCAGGMWRLLRCGPLLSGVEPLSCRKVSVSLGAVTSAKAIPRIC
jgi:hypothetical protein